MAMNGGSGFLNEMLNCLSLRLILAYCSPDLNSFMTRLGFLRTDSSHPDFIALVRLLDAELASRDGDDHAFYAQFNKIAEIKHVIVAYQDEKPVACGAFKPFEADSVEIKRMYTAENARSGGLGSVVLAELEQWARELDIQRCVLETGKRQPEAIRLYTKNGYALIPNFGQYEGDENSVCFEKWLK
jgi:GNAT superfamily N-acetyltransferase